ncbi:MAG: hypothetical protein LBB54_04535 [Cellulomonadaceae bacterium]|jgi:UDP-N-acetylmuramyl pentapeptide phosphotransferase/UDP-N-acetylglucosamine-1-phosphate transferase|nr:hypothetical protein [Cellulomonadaceae bacterium]
MPAPGKFVAAAAIAAAVTAGSRAWLRDQPPGGADRWTRTNHRGEPISLLEGPAVAAGLAAGAAVTGGRGGVAAVIATTGAGTFGIIDDLEEDTSGQRSKGLRGHLGALRQGQLTTGALKILGIGGAAFVAAVVGTRRQADAPTGRYIGDIVINSALIAGTANLVNLLDLRPGRALKAAGILALLPAQGGCAARGAVVGAGAAAWPGDLAERDMLGDGGANALGALLGTRLALGLPRPLRVVALAGVVGLTLASEKVSFSRVIDETPWLKAVDDIGRRPTENSERKPAESVERGPVEGQQ